MSKFFNDWKKYWKYAMYASKSDLKSEVATSHLSWLWWILDPIFFMLIYTFVVVIVFRTTEQYFPVFVLIGLTVWNFFDKCLKSSTKIVNSNKNIIKKVYIPKYVLILIKTFVNLFKMLISFALIIVLMIIFNVPFSVQLFNFIPILIVLYIFTFGCCTILTHFGVFIDDLTNVINIVLKMMFYLSGIFYMIETRVPQPYGKILSYANPTAFIITQFRKIIIYDQMPNYLILGGWLMIGLVLSLIGISLIYKYENSYAKVM